MKKIYVNILIIGVSAALLMTGCSSATTAGTTNTSVPSNEATQNIEGRRMQGQPGMFGKVKSIVGNEVVLELAEMPQRNAEGKKPANSGAGTGTPGAGAGTPGAGQGMRAGGSRDLKLTGETATILIPVGVPITTFSQEGMKELDIADIYAGSLLQIWFDDMDKEDKSIVRVTVMQGR